MQAPANPALIAAWLDGALQPFDKLDVHRRGLRHPAVSVFLTDGDVTLLQQRAMGKYHTPGLWANSCCTHPLWGESGQDCAVRRVGQELGVALGGLTHVGQVEYRADVGGGMVEHELVEVFRAHLPRATPLTPDPLEVKDLEWVPIADLAGKIAADPAAFTPWLKIYLRDHAAKIFGQPLPI